MKDKFWKITITMSLVLIFLALWSISSQLGEIAKNTEKITKGINNLNIGGDLKDIERSIRNLDSSLPLIR